MVATSDGVVSSINLGGELNKNVYGIYGSNNSYAPWMQYSPDLIKDPLTDTHVRTTSMKIYEYAHGPQKDTSLF